MIPQDKRQPGPPGRVGVWGHPWHGLVTDGVLTLPNAATMPYSAATAPGEADVIAFQVPGTPAVARTPEQVAADAAAGRQWLDYALISGRDPRRLYGQAIGGSGSWLYAAPDGSRWRVTIAGVPGTKNLTAPWLATLTCERFGAIGAEPESHDLTATLADWQQAIPGHAGGDYMLSGYGVFTAAPVSVDDVRPDGSAALLAIWVDLSDEPWAQDVPGVRNPLRRDPIGYVEITLSGTPGVDAAAAIAVRYSRAATLGTFTSTTVSSVTVWYHDGSGDSPAHGTWGATPNGFTDASADVGSFSGSGALVGRILAAGYDAAGALQTITLDHEYTAAATYPMPPDGTTSISRTNSYSSTGSVTLSGPAGDIGFELSEDATQIDSYTGSVTGPSSMSSSSTVDTVAGPETGGYTKIDDHADDSPFLHMSSGTPTDFSLEYSDADGSVLFFTSVANIGLPAFRVYAAITRYSATAVDLTLAITNVAGTAYDRWHYLGAVSLQATVPAIITSTEQLPYGTAHPITGEIVRASAVPVCWV